MARALQDGGGTSGPATRSGTGGGGRFSAPAKPVSSQPALTNLGAPNRLAPPAPAPRAPARSAPAQRAPSAPSYGTSYSGGNLAASGTGVIAEQPAAPPPPPPMGFDQYSADPSLAMQDAGYKTGVGAADSAFQNLIDQLTRQNANYMTDQGSTLRNLGFNEQTQQFDPTNMLGAYGQSVNNQQNDFAGRGMMDSTFYRQANDSLNGRFKEQKANIDTAGQAQQQEFNAGKTNAGVSQQSAHNQALAEAYTRYLSGYGA